METTYVKTISSVQALPVTSYTANTTPAVLDLVDFNMATGVLSLSFNKPVKGTTLAATALTILESQANGAISYTLTGGVVSTSISRSVTVTLSVADDQGLNCYLSISSTTVRDTSLLYVPQSDRTHARLIHSYVADNVAPTLAAFGFSIFNLNNGQSRLSFTETVGRTTFNSTALTLTQLFADTTSSPSHSN